MGPIENTFVIGDIDIDLRETASGKYQLIPGKEYAKDPTVTVKGGSQDCWLFVRITKLYEPDSYLDYSLAEGWQVLDAYEGVYYRVISDVTEDISFPVLSDNKITVKDTLTKTEMYHIIHNPKLIFTAFAIQSLGIDSPEDAYHELLLAEED